jgi:hypothetical protein
MIDKPDTLDAASFLVILGVFANWLPTVALMLSILWYGVRFYEWYRHRVVLKHPDSFFKKP